MTKATRSLDGRPYRAFSVPNVLVNDPAGQTFGTGNTQMEPSPAVHGDTLVCGYTDSGGLYGNGTLSGFSYSFDGGSTWTDGGSLPLAGQGSSEMLFGDPTVVTDERGRWFYLSVYDIGNGFAGPGTGDFGLALQTGVFTGGALAWNEPVLIAGGGVGHFLDSAHMAIDPARDRIYVTYTNFSLPLEGWGQIEIVTLADNGTSVVHQVVLQSEVSGQNNAGSSVAVGPDGELFCAYESDLLTGLGQGPARQIVARSNDFGVSFGPRIEAAQVIESWFSWPPGHSREGISVEYPRLAVDRTSGPHRGRVYLVWQDGLQMDFTGSLLDVAETSDGNSSVQTAQELPTQSTHWRIQGSLPLNDFVDYYRFTGSRGEHVRMVLQLEGFLSVGLRLRCGDASGASADTILAQSGRGLTEPAFFLFSLPTDGEYFVEIERRFGSGNYTGFLRKTTLSFPSVAFDHRDIVSVSSADGIDWSSKVRVNDDLGFSDQALPALAVDGCGGLHVVWYDRRFDPRCRVLADVMLASSFDAGASFTPGHRLTSVSSFWQIPADAIPNFGDNFQIVADHERLYSTWADGRRGDPDIMAAPLRIDFDLTSPDTVHAIEGETLDLDARVFHPGPFDAEYRIEITSSCADFPDTTCVFGSLGAGQDTVCAYTPLVTSGARVNLPCWLFLAARSDRSGCVENDSVLVRSDLVQILAHDVTTAFRNGAIHLAWQVSGRARFAVDRATVPNGAFERLTDDAVRIGPRNRFEYVDRTVAVGAMYDYRIVGFSDSGIRSAFGPYRVETATTPSSLLLVARPNPLQATAELRFELPHAGRVVLRVLDVRGREVAVLLDELRDHGAHTVVWNGHDTVGTLLPTGIYLAELRALGLQRVTRLVLLH